MEDRSWHQPWASMYRYVCLNMYTTYTSHTHENRYRKRKSNHNRHFSVMDRHTQQSLPPAAIFAMQLSSLFPSRVNQARPCFASKIRGNWKCSGGTTMGASFLFNPPLLVTLWNTIKEGRDSFDHSHKRTNLPWEDIIPELTTNPKLAQGRCDQRTEGKHGFPYKVRQVGAHKQTPEGGHELQKEELATHSNRDALLPVVLHALEIH